MYDRNLIHTYLVNLNLHSGFIGTYNLIIHFCDTFVSVLCKGNGSLDLLGLISKCCIIPLFLISGIFMISLRTKFPCSAECVSSCLFEAELLIRDWY